MTSIESKEEIELLCPWMSARVARGMVKTIVAERV